jgi:chromosome segregation ATPase
LRVFCEQRLSLQEQLKQKEERLSSLGRQHQEFSPHVTALEDDLAAVQESSDKRSKDLEDALHNHRLEQEGSRERVDSLHDLASKTLLTHQSDQASARDMTGHNVFLEEEKAGLWNEHDALQNHFVQHQQNTSSLRSQIQGGDTRVNFLENELILVKLVLSMQKTDLEVLKNCC